MRSGRAWKIFFTETTVDSIYDAHELAWIQLGASCAWVSLPQFLHCIRKIIVNGASLKSSRFRRSAMIMLFMFWYA